MSTSSVKPASEPRADALSTLKAWADGDKTARAVPTNPDHDLNNDQLRRLWALLNSPTSPGTINFPVPR